MKNKVIIFSLSVFSLVMMAQLALGQNNRAPRVGSGQLKLTTVTAYLQSSIVKGKNLLFCSTFQVAWNVLSDDIIKAPLQLAGDPITGKMLNERLTGKNDLSSDDYLAMAGLKKDGIVQKIIESLNEKFKENPGIDISLDKPDDILSYAFLKKDLQFANEFEALDSALNFNGKTSVKSFGIKEYASDEAHKKLADQVKILDYIDDNDFILSLASTKPNDEIVLAKITPRGTLLETLKLITNRIKAKKSFILKDKDTLQIPQLDFDILHSYSDLIGKFVLNKGFEDYFIAKAIQSIRFRLNEKGALLKSEAAIVLEKEISMEMPKRLIFDRPFLIYLKEKGALYPYFAMWVDNPELLIRNKIQASIPMSLK